MATKVQVFIGMLEEKYNKPCVCVYRRIDLLGATWDQWMQERQNAANTVDCDVTGVVVNDRVGPVPGDAEAGYQTNSGGIDYLYDPTLSEGSLILMTPRRANS